MVSAPNSSYQVAFALWFVFTFQSLLAISCIWIRVAARLYDPNKPLTWLWRFVLALDQTCLGPILAVIIVGPVPSLFSYLIAIGNFTLAGLLAPLIFLCNAVGFWVSSKDDHVM